MNDETLIITQKNLSDQFIEELPQKIKVRKENND